MVHEKTRTLQGKFKEFKFDLKPEDVTATVERLKQMQIKWSEDLTSNDEEGRITAARIVDGIVHQLDIIQTLGPQRIVSNLQGLYSQAEIFAQQGLNDIEVGRNLNLMFPSATKDYRHLLNLTPWGYNIYNNMIGARVRDREI